LKGLGLASEALPAQHDKTAWLTLRDRFAVIFRRETRDHWCEVFAGTEACVSPVLSLSELAAHPHLSQRGNFVDVDGALHPAPAPRFSRTPGSISRPPLRRSTDDSAKALDAWGESQRNK
jgi:alpha-methylacyl-CoA racemase